MEQELKDALEAMKGNLEGKSAEIVKAEIKAFEEKHAKHVEEVSELKEALKAVQAHADKLDVKLQKKEVEQKGMEKKSLNEVLIEKKNEIKEVAFGNRKDVEIKALTSVGGSITNNASGFFLPSIGQLGVKERSLYNVLPKVPISDSNNGGLVRYRDWDEATTVRAAAMVAEGAQFPESTAKFEYYSIPLRKIGDTLPVTEEFFEDESQAAAELAMFLDVNVKTVIDGQIINGDGTGQNLKGLLASVPEYTAVASGLVKPNLKDLSIKVRNDITRTRGSKYNPDMLVVSSATMEDLILAKTNEGQYLFDENTGTLGGLFVVVDENMQDNHIVIGDRRYAKIYEKTGITLSESEVGNQFIEDEKTIKARKRMLFLIRTVDQTGFRKVSDVDAALATLGTAKA